MPCRCESRWGVSVFHFLGAVQHGYTGSIKAASTTVCMLNLTSPYSLGKRYLSQKLPLQNIFHAAGNLKTQQLFFNPLAHRFVVIVGTRVLIPISSDQRRKVPTTTKTISTRPRRLAKAHCFSCSA